MKILFTKRTLFLSVFLILSMRVFGQVTLQGIVTDSLTQEPLIGASVFLVGTSQGSATNFDGEYKIPNIPEGNYQVRISYVGYLTKTMSLDLRGKKTLELFVQLSTQSIQGKTIEITAQAQGQKAAINQQLTSSTITNVVAAEKIHELPDDNAATALSRLPGLSLMNGDKVVIRGIQSKMNVVLVNGIQLPSTDMDDRSTNLGFISSNMLSGIEVMKALTPDMDANSIGGVVNLRLREAPVDFHADMMVQGVYNTQDRTADNFKSWASVSNRFFEDKLGVFIQGNMDRSNIGNDQTTANYDLNFNDPGYGEAPYLMHDFAFIDEENIITNIGGSVILDYKLPNGKIVLQNTLAHTVNDMSRYRMEMDFAVTELAYALNRDKHNKELLINALQAEYNFGDIKAELSLSHSYSDKATDIRYGDPGNEFGFQNQTSRFPFGVDANGTAISYVNQMPYLTPDDVYNIQINPHDWEKANIYGWAITREEAFKQHLYNGTLDFTIPMSFSQDVSGKVKVGGKFTRSTRKNDVEESYRRTGEEDFYNGVTNFLSNRVLDKLHPLTFGDVRNYDYTRGDYFLDDTYDFEYALSKDLMDQFMPAAKNGWAKSRHKTRSERYDFNGAEIFSAGYLMGDFNIGSRLSVIAGVRFEHYNMDYKANFVYVTHSVDGNGNIYDTLNTVNRNDDRWFPNVQLRYKFADWCDLRLAYTESVSRPDYQAILPNVYYAPNETAQAGNTMLKPTISQNADFYLSFYNNELGLFTVGGFYKKLSNVFFSTNIYYKNLNMYDISFPDSAAWKSLGVKAPGQSEQVTTYVNNPNPAYIRGFELDWQTHFWYLPGILSSLVLDINYTRVWSDMDYRQIRNQAIAYQDGRFTRYRYVTTDTVRNARLLYQGDHILNIALGVDYKDFSGRISFNMQGDVITTVGSRPEEDIYTGNVYKWDITLQQKLPIKGLSVTLSGVNIFHNPTKTYERFRRTMAGSIGENLVSTIYSPRRFELSLRYSL